MVKGLDLFARTFAGFEDQYVLIGGVATLLALEDAGLEGRGTKDLDIVLCVEALTAEFGERMWAFISGGGYQVSEQSEVPRHFYRFQKPANADYPSMLEFFARDPGFAPLADGAHLTPVPIDEAVESLSAILLDEDYYAFIHTNKRMLGGVHVVNEQCLIPLKARAWLDLRQRAATGEKIDNKNITKHRNDVLRLTQLLRPDSSLALPGSIAADMRRFVAEVDPEVDAKQLGALAIKGVAPGELLALLRGVYGIG